MVWLEILVANLATNFQDLVAKVKNLVTLAPVLGAILRPAYTNVPINVKPQGEGDKQTQGNMTFQGDQSQIPHPPAHSTCKLMSNSHLLPVLT